MYEDLDEPRKLAHNTRHGGPSKQKDVCHFTAVQVGQAKEFMSSNPKYCEEEEEQISSRKCRCD